ncbi:MBL fold metallo-hydrolase [Halovenus sp. WSH3]|uniref:MBL fold metallo-hydrolase n=1 Tax=Halovenus carboxidivorans TaxID=2692199 RepID=A0A6B0T4C6_9EURY|nr:MBL fold metallo-hydrolase [Halovenus carboxidivorans]MXR51867.1 MBL fold metallo-hydrolase [Halovenus carboxidivorans]
MQVRFLGTGSAMPTGERFQTGLLFEGEQPLLVDCGSGVLHGLARTEVGYEGADTLLLTHHHLDHVSDIPVLMKARWLAGEESLTIYGPGGTEELIEGTLDTHEYMQDRLDLRIEELTPGGGPYEIAGFEITAMETRHSMECLAYRFERGDGPPVVFSGDSEAFEELIEFGDGAAVLIHDCSFPDEVDVSNHPTPTTLGRALADADAEIGRVYLTHLYPHTEGRHEEMLDSIKAVYDGEVRFARDGLSLDISAIDD